MRLLLDTHTFLWFITEDRRLSKTAERLIRDGRNELLLSVASIWEVAIKVRLDRLPIPEPLEKFIPDQLQLNRTHLLPIDLRHTFAVARLPLHHRDPFDRLLICQAQVEGLPIATADPAFSSYEIEVLW
jgi:PIN domain nuclease of toxin-antitoxin system